MCLKLKFPFKTLRLYYWSTRPTHTPPVVITGCPSVRPSVPKLQNETKLLPTRVCELAELIIDDNCLVQYMSYLGHQHQPRTPSQLAICWPQQKASPWWGTQQWPLWSSPNVRPWSFHRKSANLLANYWNSPDFVASLG